ncbi:MAG TPA: hypothetical protein VGI98_08185 [Candidatus Limnocylindrales bacterium]
MALTARRSLAIGAIVAVVGMIVAGRPYVTLYDGVVPNEPYRYLAPGPGQAGEPSTTTISVKVVDGGNDLVAAATSETEPQAQVFVIPQGLALVPGTTQINVSIAAVVPPGPQPTDGHIAGNVYAFTVTNQSGVPISAKAEAQASIELRAPDPGTSDATIERYDGSAWRPLSTTAAGASELFTAVVTEFGEFAIVLPGAAATVAPPGSPAGSSVVPGSAVASPPVAGPPATDGRATLTLILGALAIGIVVLVAAVALLPSRGRRPPPGRSIGGGAGRGAGSRR